MANYNPTPALGGALWNGNQQLVTKREFISTINNLSSIIEYPSSFSTFYISSLYANNANISTINFSTMFGNNANISSLNVSSINGLEFTQTGINVSTINADTGDFLTTILSTLQFNPNFSAGGINPSFNIDLGLGNGLAAIAGAFGLGVFGAVVGVPVVAGTITYGLTAGITSMIAPRTTNNISNNIYEQINYTSQLEISTLSADTTSVFRTISTIPSTIVINPQGDTTSTINIESFISTIIPAGTTCIRSVADPIQLISSPYTYNQAVSQWVALPSGSGLSTISTPFTIYNDNPLALTRSVNPNSLNKTLIKPVDSFSGFLTYSGDVIAQGASVTNVNALPADIIAQRIDFCSMPLSGSVDPMPTITGFNSGGASISINAQILQAQVSNAIFSSTITLAPSTCLVSETGFPALKIKNAQSNNNYAQCYARAYGMRANDTPGTNEGTFIYQDLLDRPGFVNSAFSTNTLAYLTDIPSGANISAGSNINLTSSMGTTFINLNQPINYTAGTSGASYGVFGLQQGYNDGTAGAGFGTSVSGSAFGGASILQQAGGYLGSTNTLTTQVIDSGASIYLTTSVPPGGGIYNPLSIQANGDINIKSDTGDVYLYGNNEVKIINASNTNNYSQVTAKAYTIKANETAGTKQGILFYQDLLDRPGFINDSLSTNTLAYLSDVPFVAPVSKLPNGWALLGVGLYAGGSPPVLVNFGFGSVGGTNLPTIPGGFYSFQGQISATTDLPAGGGYTWYVEVLNNAGGGGTGSGNATFYSGSVDPFVSAPTGLLNIPFNINFIADGSYVQIQLGSGSPPSIPVGNNFNINIRPFYLWRIR